MLQVASEHNWRATLMCGAVKASRLIVPLQSGEVALELRDGSLTCECLLGFKDRKRLPGLKMRLLIRFCLPLSILLIVITAIPNPPRLLLPQNSLSTQTFYPGPADQPRHWKLPRLPPSIPIQPTQPTRFKPTPKFTEPLILARPLRGKKLVTYDASMSPWVLFCNKGVDYVNCRRAGFCQQAKGHYQMRWNVKECIDSCRCWHTVTWKTSHGVILNRDRPEMKRIEKWRNR